MTAWTTSSPKTWSITPPVPKAEKGGRRAVVTCFPDVVSQTRAIIVDGDRAAVHLVLSGTHRASAMPLLEGIAPTGARVDWEFMHLVKLDRGVIIEHSAVRDDLGLLRQLQADPVA